MPPLAWWSSSLLSPSSACGTGSATGRWLSGVCPHPIHQSRIAPTGAPESAPLASQTGERACAWRSPQRPVVQLQPRHHPRHPRSEVQTQTVGAAFRIGPTSQRKRSCPSATCRVASAAWACRAAELLHIAMRGLSMQIARSARLWGAYACLALRLVRGCFMAEQGWLSQAVLASLAVAYRRQSRWAMWTVTGGLMWL